MPSLSPEHRLRIIIAAGLFAGLALSPALWLTNRAYPHIPIISTFGQIPEPFDGMAYGAMLLLALAIAFVPKPAKWMGLCAGLGFVMGTSARLEVHSRCPTGHRVCARRQLSQRPL